MTFGPGRAAQKPEVTSVTLLTREDILGFKPAKAIGKVKALHDSHHMLARLYAMGLRPGEAAARVGYSIGHVSTNIAPDPAFQELVDLYRKEVNEEFREAVDEYFSLATTNRNKAARRLGDLLDDEAASFSPTQLLAIQADGADRTGYPKRKEAVNYNVDWASRMDKAIARSNQARLVSPGSPGDGAGQGEVLELRPQAVSPAPLRRRA